MVGGSIYSSKKGYGEDREGRERKESMRQWISLWKSYHQLPYISREMGREARLSALLEDF